MTEHQTNEPLLDAVDIPSPPNGDGLNAPVKAHEASEQAAKGKKSQKSKAAAGAQTPYGVHLVLADFNKIVNPVEDGADITEGVVQYVRKQSDLLDESSAEAKWKQGAGIEHLLDTVLKASSKEEKTKFFSRCGLAYPTAMERARVYRRYRKDPTEYFLYGYAIAKELAAFKQKVRQRLFDDACQGNENPTYEDVWKKAKSERENTESSSRKSQTPLPTGHTINLAPNSTVRARAAGLVLRLDAKDLDHKGRKIVERLLKYLSNEDYQLPPSQNGEDTTSK